MCRTESDVERLLKRVNELFQSCSMNKLWFKCPARFTRIYVRFRLLSDLLFGLVRQYWRNVAWADICGVASDSLNLRSTRVLLYQSIPVF